jgi:predicted amidohydrolase
MPERAELVVAVHQPRVRLGEAAAANVDDAVAATREAAAAGAGIVLFPEGYPGPMRVSSAYETAEPMAAVAAETGCAVCWSRVEPGGDGSYYKVAYVYGPEGQTLLRYVRAHPATGDVHPTLNGTALAPGSELALFELDGVPIGLLICSELWLPEVARILAVRGAEVILAPAGGGFGRVAGNWQLVTDARAIENQCYVAMTQSLYADERGSALIAGPEEVVASSADEGVLVGPLDLSRVRWLRARDDSMEEPKPFSSLPGLLRARRPELYGELAEPAEGLYDYWHAARSEVPA